MTSIELEALRRLLFFSVPEAAKWIAQEDEVEWRRWEADTRAVPSRIAVQMSQLSVWRQQAIAAIDAQVRDTKGVDSLALVWYQRPTDILGDVIFFRPQQSVCAHAKALYGVHISLVQFDHQEYRDWLDGREDSNIERAQWAATRV